MTPSEVDALTAALTQLASAGGAGLAVSFLLEFLRSAYPKPATLPASGLARAFYLLIYTPRYTRFLTIALTVALGSAAAWCMAWINGTPPNAALAGLGAFAVSQLFHARHLSPVAPEEPGNVATPMKVDYALLPTDEQASFNEAMRNQSQVGGSVAHIVDEAGKGRYVWLPPVDDTKGDTDANP